MSRIIGGACRCCYHYVPGVDTFVDATTASMKKLGMSAMQRIIDLDRGTCHRHAPSTLHGDWPAVEERESCGDYASVLEFDASLGG